MVQRLNYFQRIWRRLSFQKSGESLVRHLGVIFGHDCKFVHVNIRTFGAEPYLIRLGDHVEISGNVRFLPHDGSVWVFRTAEPNIDIIKPISVGNNVFIGYGSIILPGATIGDNCIIGAGSVVAGSIPSSSVAAGVPAKVIRSLDEHYEKVKPSFLQTKKMNRAAKKDYLLQHFDINETLD